VSEQFLTTNEIINTFVNTQLESDYNFLRDDLVKLAHAFVAVAEPKIAKEERSKCVEIARNVNHLVAAKIEEFRGK
jgi:hypothetical protein